MRGFPITQIVFSAILILLLSSLKVFAQSADILTEFSSVHLQEESQRFSMLDDGSFGASIDSSSGALSIRNVDVNLPGNFAIPVQFSRAWMLNGMDPSGNILGGWTPEVPHISIRIDQTFGIQAPPRDNGVCLSDVFIYTSGTTGGAPSNKVTWSGINLSIPGEGKKPVAKIPSESVVHPYENALVEAGTTADHWKVYCDITKFNESNEAKANLRGRWARFGEKKFYSIVAVSPNGWKYTFDNYGSNYGGAEVVPDASCGGRSRNSCDGNVKVIQTSWHRFLTSKIEDSSGNSVEYEYDYWGHLKKISASDGREITIQYKSRGFTSKPIGAEYRDFIADPGEWRTPLIDTVSANGRVWKYEYALQNQNGYVTDLTHNLRSVIQLDGRRWEYELPVQWNRATDFYNSYKPWAADEFNSQNYSGSGAMRILNEMWIRHPAGAKMSFETGIIKDQGTTEQHGVSRPTLGNDINLNRATCSTNVHGYGPTHHCNFIARRAVLSRSITANNIEIQNWTYEYEQNNNCPATEINGYKVKWRRVTQPDDTAIKSYHICTDVKSGLHGKITRKEYISANNQIVRTVNARFAEIAYSEPYNNTDAGDDIFRTSETLTTSEVVSQDGDTYTTEYDYNTNQSSANYSFGNPVETRSWSNYVISGEANKRITQTTYEHEKDKWILGLPKTVTRNGRLLSRTNYTPLGQVEKRYQYNQTTPVATYTYHSEGTLASVTDAVGRRTEAHDWHRGKPKRVERWKGSNLLQTMGRDVDDNGWIKSQTDAKGRTTSYQHDSMGRLTRITPHRPPSGQGYKLPDTTIVYTFGDTTVQMITTGPKREFVYYDSLLRPVNELTYDFTTAKRIWTRTKYDALGRPIFKSQPSTVPWEAKGVETEYDALGRVTQIRENVAPYATTTHEYLSYHRKKVTDPEGNAVTTYQYGWDGPDSGVPYLIRQHGVTDTWIRRNVHGQIWRVDQNGSSGGFNVNQKQHFYYDAQQRLCRTRTPEGGDTIYRYNEANEVIAYAKGQSAIGYCTSIYDNSAKVNLTYDDLGRLKTTDFADPNTPDIWRDYDANGNMTKNYRGQGTSKEVLWDYTYDGNDMLTDEELVIGGSKAFDIRYKYNANGHMYRKYLPSGRGISYFNDGLGRHTKVSWGTETYADNASYHPSGALETLSFGNGQVFTQELNARLLPKRLRVTKGGADVQNLYYDYYADGRIRHKLDYVDSTYSAIHFYDGAGRLERANSTAWGGATFSYDALGNLREKRFNKNGAIRTVTNNYNSKNRIVGSTDTDNINYGFGYDARGNVTQTGLLNFTYDRSDQPVAMSGTAPNTGTQIDAAYLYDGNMKRVKSVVNGKTIYNVYDLSGRLAHVDEITDGKETDYLHGMGQTLARIKDSGNGDVFTYLHPDHLGSPQAGTTEAGGVSFTEHYTPYGEALISPAANDNQSGFTGHIKDKDTGLNYMQARYYDPNIGRFLSIDPVGFAETGLPQQFNRYAYTWNDPINAKDPDGEFVQFVAKFVVDVGLEVAIQAASGESINLGAATKSAAVGLINPAKTLQRAQKLGSLASKANKQRQLAKNIAQGNKGEALTQAKLGDNIAGKQVTLESSKGTRARLDFVTKDGGIVETKTGGAKLSKGQQDIFDDINNGRPVTPRGANADAAGLPRNEPIKLPSCSVDRPC